LISDKLGTLIPKRSMRYLKFSIDKGRSGMVNAHAQAHAQADGRAGERAGVCMNHDRRTATGADGSGAGWEQQAGL